MLRLTRPARVLGGLMLALGLAACTTTDMMTVGGAGLGGYAGYEVGRSIGGTSGAAIGTVVGVLVGGASGRTLGEMATSYSGPSYGYGTYSAPPAPPQATTVVDGTLYIDEQQRAWVATRGASGYCVGTMNGTTWVPTGFDRYCNRVRG